MKSFFTTVLIAFTTLLSAQNAVNFVPATSIMDDNAVASVNEMYYAEETVEVSNEFNLSFVAGDYFGDVVISYDLDTKASVKLEVRKAGSQSFYLVNETQSGSQKVLWDENIEAGKYTISLFVNNKVETKTVNLAN